MPPPLMTIDQDFESTILAGQSNNFIKLKDVIDFIDVIFTITGTTTFSFTNRYASINGNVELNIKEITRLVYDNLDNYSDPFNYINSSTIFHYDDPYHYIKLNLDITDNLSTNISKDLIIINSSLQTGEDVLMNDFIDKPLRLIEKMPYFTGIDQSISILRHDILKAGSGIERISDKTNIDFSQYISEEIEDCGGVVIKWLNRYGGYDYWVFNKVYSQKTIPKSLGKIKNNWTDRINAISDYHSLGFTAKKTMNINSDVDIKYMPEVESLITSPEIYIFNRSGEINTKANGIYVKIGIKQKSLVTIRTNYNTVRLKLTLELNDIKTQTLV